MAYPKLKTKVLKPRVPSSILLQRKLDRAKALEEQNEFAKAERLYAELAASFGREGLDPGNCYLCIGRTQINQKRYAEAIETLKRSLEHKPDLLEAYLNLAIAHRELKQWGETIKWGNKAIEVNPEDLTARTVTGWAQYNSNIVTPCIQNFLAVLAQDPNHADGLLGLASIYTKIGDIELSIPLYRRIIELQPDNQGLLNSYFFALLYDPKANAARLLEEHLRFEELVGKPAQQYWKPFPNRRDPERRIRIGYVSGDFRGHVMRYFMKDMMAAHNREGFELVLFPNSATRDEFTEEFKQIADQWADLWGKTDAEAEQIVRKLEIDILIDTSGHTGDHRLTLFARRPAPVQVTWMGYSSTTGLKAIDYIIVDEVIAPSSEPAHFTEKPIRMPNSYTVYTAPPAPEIGPPPKLENGYVTFGCFNNPSKIGRHQLELWSAIMTLMPEARLVFSYNVLKDVLAQERIRDVFRRCGVDPARIEFASLTNTYQAFYGYNQIDVALDPSPYNGTTTTFEAIWMGVPVITLPGDSFVSRTTASILTFAGLSGMICSTPEEYVERALTLAADTDTLVRLRKEMRAHLLTTPVFQPERFARDLEAAYRKIFADWCAAG